MKPCEDGGAHHWIIESPDGRRMLPAKCKKCKAVRLYPSSIEEDPIARSKPDSALNRQGPYFKEDGR